MMPKKGCGVIEETRFLRNGRVTGTERTSGRVGLDRGKMHLPGQQVQT